jgi:hypothetical protein
VDAYHYPEREVEGLPGQRSPEAHASPGPNEESDHGLSSGSGESPDHRGYGVVEQR